MYRYSRQPMMPGVLECQTGATPAALTRRSGINPLNLCPT